MKRNSLTLLGLAVLLATAPAGNAQRSRVVEKPETMLQLQRMPGQLISRGVNDEPVGELRVRTYLLEELQLDQPLQVEISGQRTEVSRSWRLTVTGGPFTVRDMPAIVWIGDKAVGVGIESTDLRRISVVIFDRDLLREGAPISLSFGEHDPQRTELPEKLTLKSVR